MTLSARSSPGSCVSVPFQISCGECARAARAARRNCSAVPFMSTYGFGPAVERWGGFLSDLVGVPYAEHMLVALPDGARAGGRRERLGQHHRRLAGRRAGARARAGGPGAGRRWRRGRLDRAVRGGHRRGARLGVGALRRRRRVARATAAERWARRRWPRCPSGSDHSRSPSMRAPTRRGSALALRSTAPDGICTSAAIYFGEQPSLPLLEMYTKGITFRTGRANAREAMPHVLELAASGALRPERVTSSLVAWARPRGAARGRLDEARDRALSRAAHPRARGAPAIPASGATSASASTTSAPAARSAASSLSAEKPSTRIPAATPNGDAGRRVLDHDAALGPCAHPAAAYRNRSGCGLPRPDRKGREQGVWRDQLGGP